MDLAWKLHRLSRMSTREIVYRARQTAHAQLERRGIGRARPQPPKGRGGKPWVSDLPKRFDKARYIEAANRILAGRFKVFALAQAELGFPPQWNKDPRTGRVAPLSFGKTLNYRDERIVGDIKYLWEPSRHFDLVTLAQAWHLTHDTRYAEGCRTLVESWIDQCPYPMGVHWTSSLEHGIRITNWAFAWHLLGGDHSPLFEGDHGAQFKQRWLQSVRQHCHFIAGHFSRHSSANNHLLGEYMGLFVASVTWGLWSESVGWRSLAREGFEREALLQNAPDGVNREQAIWYHHEVTDMMLICGLLARANACDFSTDYWRRLESMLEYVASIMDVRGNVPMIGDSDDAVMVRLDPTADFHVYRSQLAAGAVLFSRGDFKVKARGFDDKTRWLLGDASEAAFESLAPSEPKPRRAFPDGGYYILGSNFEQDDEVRIIADAAPLGYLSIAAHGHADVLSFTLSASGCELLIDPGTYAYHTQERWRDYFKGTSAHNTVRIDGVDQSVSGGKFMWIKQAQARCRQFDPGAVVQRWVASHDGYSRLKDPVDVERALEYDTANRRLVVTDRLTCKGEHQIESFWHFAPGCVVEVTDNAAIVRNQQAGLILRWGQGQQARIYRGSEQPLLGWTSRSFDVKEPSPTLVVRTRIRGPAQWQTSFEITH